MTTTPEADPIEIAYDSYDCHATDTSWRHGLYLDPERRRVSHWQHYGNGTPMPVWHGRAVIIGLPFGAVGEQVERIVRGDDFRELVAKLFSLYEGHVWNGSNHLGSWKDMYTYGSERHELELMIGALFDQVDTYWPASDWMSQVWSDDEADDIRASLQKGKTLGKIADDMIADARRNGAYIDRGDLLSTLENLMAEYPAQGSDCEVAS